MTGDLSGVLPDRDPPAGRDYRDGDVFTGVVKAVAPYSVEIDLSVI